MGTESSLCSATNRVNENDPFSFIFNYDPLEDDIYHGQSLMCKDIELQKILKTYQDKLRQLHSLYIQPNSRSHSITLKSKEKQFKCNYLRPYQILRGQVKNKAYPLIGRQKFTYADIIVRDPIMQYFGVFLCFLAENQHLLEDLIITQQNSYGLQVVKIKNYDKKEFLIVDDLIVCEGGNPLFVQPIQNKYLWPCILEKAWLKVKGSSSRKIIKSTPEQVIERFFNFPLQKIQFQNQQEENVIQKIKKYLYNTNQKRIILTSQANPKHKIGLSNQNFFYIGSFNSDGRRLFYLRNPCIDAEFRGIHSIISEEIKSKLYQELKISSVQRGCFILDQTEFVEQIAYATIIHNQVQEQHILDKIQLLLEKEKYIRFQLKEKRPFSLGLEQRPDFDHLQCQKHHYPISYQLINCTQSMLIGGLQNEQACFGMKKTYFVDEIISEVPKGIYILRLKTKPKIKNQVHSNFYLFTNDRTTINFQSEDNLQKQLKQQFEISLKNICKKQLRNKRSKPKPGSFFPQSSFQHIIVWLGDIVLIYIEKNENNKAQRNVQVNFPELMNLQCVSIPLQRGQYKNFEIDNNLLLIFEKISLTAQTQIRKYSIEGY